MRKSKDVNKAMLAKVLWRLHTEGDSIWAQLLKSKYKMHSLEDLNLKPGNRASLIGRSICWIEDLFRRGLARTVINGRSTLFWTDRWLGEVKLQDLVRHPLPAHVLNRVVFYYWAVGIGWRWSEFDHYLPHFILLRIAAVVLDVDDETEDALSWWPSSSKLFSVKSAHSLQAG